MCGIVGYWAKECRSDILSHSLEQAVESLHHRGPDDQGVWKTSDSSVGLGHSRLSILDLSSSAHQPMVSRDGRYIIAYNGEVYNFLQIRQELETRGYAFRSNGYTEVVLNAFQEWAEKAVHRFIGMFAFAIWDEKEGRLLLFRDRLGVKPLYYAWVGKKFLFASELKALQALKEFHLEIDRHALGEFLQYGYISAPRSIYKKVWKLPPGHWLELRQDDEPIVKQYWSVLDALDSPLTGSEEDLAEQLEELLVDAFKYRLVSDVPVGVFLSGGVDSSLVTSLLQRHSSRDIRTFTIGFRGNRFDESRYARRVAEHLGTMHTELVVDETMAMDILPDWASLYDEPFGDSSDIPTFLVSKLAREQVKVALSADGGDELFGGYNNYLLRPRDADLLRRTPYFLKSFGAHILNGLSKKTFWSIDSLFNSGKGNKTSDRLKKLSLALPSAHPAVIFDLAVSIWLPYELKTLLGSYSSDRKNPMRIPVPSMNK